MVGEGIVGDGDGDSVVGGARGGGWRGSGGGDEERE